MRIGRTLPPAAAPIYVRDIISGLRGLIRGKREVERFRSELRDYFGVKYCFLVSSGKAALTLILQVLKHMHPGRDQVLIPAYTCYSVPSAAVKAGLKVALCDVNPKTLDFDYNQLASRLTERTLCIIANHLFGYVSDLDKIMAVAKTRKLCVIEDAAQAMGGQHRGRKVGTIGDIGFFSLGRGKNISAIDGGIILTNDSIMAESLQSKVTMLPHCNPMDTTILILKALLINAFLKPSLYWFPQGLPFLRLGLTVFSIDFEVKSMSGFQAGLAKNWRQKLEEFNKLRENNANFYMAHTDTDRIGRIESHQDTRSVYLRLPIIPQNGSTRDLCLNGTGNSLGISPMYPGSIDSISQIEDQLQGDTYPGARRIAQNLLTLPTHSLLTRADMNRILDFLNNP